jgi:hypothetical protein
MPVFVQAPGQPATPGQIPYGVTAASRILGGFATTVFAAVRQWDALVPVPVLLSLDLSGRAPGKEDRT